MTDVVPDATAEPDAGDPGLDNGGLDDGGLDDDGAGRGTLTVREKVAQRLAVRAALDTPDVVASTPGLTKIAGRSSPQAQLTLAGNRVTAHLKVTVAWPAPAVEVASAVQRNVAHTLSTMAGLQVDRVDVTVEQLSTTTTDVKRVQ
ncbi:Asp23/Gls24 family envelope stress response protein [Mycolicibacterium canariasense]|uniref:Asp23/Gls24 family envelope stress response protein n=1 Tax=Mycolicibacterium canariasense TaxID=228230 RepID=UPI000788E662|nr:Asp23/Gls24 family envelope stress response protein [Mycolicibacterium canariasense]MCV7210366.1 Asp23/Gls24 family envelope stress response protein [Mycolicibacterium canariasense]